MTNGKRISVTFGRRWTPMKKDKYAGTNGFGLPDRNCKLQKRVG